jgi:hypothetical protein
LMSSSILSSATVRSLNLSIGSSGRRRGSSRPWPSTPQSAAHRTSGIRCRRPQPSTIDTGATDGTTVAVSRVPPRKPINQNTPLTGNRSPGMPICCTF